MISTVLSCLLALAAAGYGAKTIPRDEVLTLLATSESIGIVRDSGQPVTQKFLEDCSTATGPTHLKLDCPDLTSVFEVTQLGSEGHPTALLVTQDGASVENRWLFVRQSNGFVDVTATAWPQIPVEIISERMIATTRDPIYTVKYLRQSAHSLYRVRHPPRSTDPFAVVSGVPDASYGTKIGELYWDGSVLRFQ